MRITVRIRSTELSPQVLANFSIHYKQRQQLQVGGATKSCRPWGRGLAAERLKPLSLLRLSKQPLKIGLRQHRCVLPPSPFIPHPSSDTNHIIAQSKFRSLSIDKELMKVDEFLFVDGRLKTDLSNYFHFPPPTIDCPVLAGLP